MVTHNVGALTEARGLRLEVILLGGTYRPRSNVVDGPAAVEFVGPLPRRRCCWASTASTSKRA